VEEDKSLGGKVGLKAEVARSLGSIWRVIEGEVIILTPENATLHVLNELGTRIWELMDGPIRVEEIVSKIVAEYEVDEETVKKDVLDFLSSLAEIGALEVREVG
jgi:hypothetical protein